MKYWNRDNEIRQRCWTKVEQPHYTSKGPWVSMRELKQWCQQQSSTGKFYFYYGAVHWWFEHPEDALWFKLRWA